MRATIALYALLGLAACNREPQVSTTDASPDEVAAKVEQAGLQQVKMQPGEWTTSIKMGEISIPGIDPAMARQSAQQTAGMMSDIRTCLTQADVDKPGARAFGQQAQDNCTFDKFEMGAGKIDYTMTCKLPNGGGQVKTSINGTYTPQSYALAMKSEGRVPGMPGNGTMTTNATVTGKRIGACKA